jgi:hypothetical protein
MAKHKQDHDLKNQSQFFSIAFKVGNSIEKVARFSDDFGKIGIIKLKEVSAGGYHFCWVDWGNGLLKPEHYNCIRKVKHGN